MSLHTSDGDTTVLVVDDHELIRQGLVGAFGREPGMTVVDAAATVTEALKVYETHGPPVVVTDLQLPDGTGLDIYRRSATTTSRQGLAVVTMHSGDEQIFAAMEAGASAFVGKDAPSAEVVKAAKHAVVSPRSFLCAGLVGAMMRRASAESRGSPTGSTRCWCSWPTAWAQARSPSSSTSASPRPSPTSPASTRSSARATGPRHW